MGYIRESRISVEGKESSLKDGIRKNLLSDNCTFEALPTAQVLSSSKDSVTK